MKLIFCCALLAVLGTGVAAGASRPNLLLIVTDDQRPDTIHALGNGVIRTPNFDRLVNAGMAFTRAYAGYPICHVSRAEILTGCPAFRALPAYPGGAIDPGLRTLARTFHDAGYHTWYSGKWHNDGQPRQRGYDGTRGLYTSGGAKGVVQPEVDERGHPLTGYRGWTFKTDDGKVELDQGVGLTPNISAHIADAAIGLLKESRRDDQPFLLHVNFTAPHDPRLQPPGDAWRYDPDKIPLPGNFAPQHPFDHGNVSGRDELLLPKPLSDRDVRVELAVYYAIISHLDAQIGRILDTLDELDLAQNTVVIVTSDQGLALGSHGLLGKQNQYEHSAGSPLIIRGPGVPAGKRSDALCLLRDIFPTACDLAGVPVPPTVQATSLAPVLKGEKQSVHEFITGTFTNTQRMIRDNRWKLVVYPQAGQTQLFDLEADPLERHNLAGEAAYADVQNRLAGKLQRWRADNGDPLGE